MPSRLIPVTYNVSAYCSNCEATTSFEQRQAVTVISNFQFIGLPFTRRLYVVSQCAGCGRGGFAEIVDRGNVATAALVEFYPDSVPLASLPLAVPQDIQSEFREAEKCASHKLNRAASSLFRSVLEKVLISNGYTKSSDSSIRDLQKRIDAAAADGVITEARRARAHENIRTLGNDVLHEEWREVSDDEVGDAHRYMQRILEDFYDDRATTERILIEKGRLAPPRAAPAQ